MTLLLSNAQGHFFLGVAMAVGSMVAGTVATMNSNSAKTQKTMKKAVNSVANFVDNVSSMM